MGRKGKYKSNNITSFSNNVAGLKTKLPSLKAHIKATQSSIITLQETHATRKGTFQIKGYKIFEAIRKNKKDGGSLVGAHCDLNPTVVKEYEDDFELIVIEIETNKNSIRIITGYGPQETWPESERLPFFYALDAEVLNSKLSGKSIII